VEHFKSLAQRDGESRAFDEGALQALSTYTWPGNIRELENLVHRLLLTSSATIGADDVRALLEKNGSRGRFSSAVLRSAPLGELLLDLEKEYLVQLHADRQGNLESMARRLGITVRALYDRFKRLGIRPQELK
jgi:DNA-binding NtrC family response regulator